MQTVTDVFHAAAGKSSFIRKMFEKGIELKQQFGEDAVCDFSLGNPDVPPPEAARAVLHKLADDAIQPLGLGYCPNAGIPAVRDAIAKHLSKQQGIELKGADVMMTVGAASALAQMTVSIRTASAIDRILFIPVLLTVIFLYGFRD